MSVNKNIKNGDFREIFTYRDENDDNKPKLLKDLVNTDASIKNKVIASIFLRCVKSNVSIILIFIVPSECLSENLIIF